MRKRWKRYESSVSESMLSSKSKLFSRISKRSRSWTSKQSLPSRKQSGLASVVTTGGGGATIGPAKVSPLLVSRINGSHRVAVKEFFMVKAVILNCDNRHIRNPNKRTKTALLGRFLKRSKHLSQFRPLRIPSKTRDSVQS